MEVYATLQGYATPDHHWPTAKLVMLGDVTGSITFTTVSPGSFMPVTCAQCEPSLIGQENGAPMSELPMLALAEHKGREESVRKDKERATVCGHRMSNHSILGGCLAFASIVLVVLFICTKSGEIEYRILKWRIDIPEVELTWCYTVTIKCSLNVFE